MIFFSMCRRIILAVTSVCFVIAAVTAQGKYGRTHLYKRVMIVEGANKTTSNDDAHYITFNNKGFYDSDSKGNTLGGYLMTFEGSKANLHCYEGVMFGENVQCFFSEDYSRLNIKVKDKTMVYQRESGNTTTASWRSAENSSAENANIIFNSTPQMVIAPNSGVSNSSTVKTERDCTLCHGTGKYGEEIVYQPDYTGKQPSVYCSVCGRTTTPHSHRQKMCQVCKGRGKIR